MLKFRRLSILLFLIVFILLVSFTLTYFLDQLIQLKPQESVLGQIDQTSYYPVTRVIDGDTVEILINGQKESVRLLGIDTPEISGNPPDCFGPEAASYLDGLLANQSVRLESDTLQSNRDRYSRLLRYLYLPDGTFINAHLVELGYATVYTKLPSNHQAIFLQLENKARQDSLGLWSACSN